MRIFLRMVLREIPVACAAALATLETYKEEGLFERAASLAPVWEEALHSLAGEPNIIDIRNIGLMGAVEMSSIPGKIGHRAYEAMRLGFHEHDIMLRITGDTIALSPPLIVSEEQISQIIDKLRKIVHAVA